MCERERGKLATRLCRVQFEIRRKLSGLPHGILYYLFRTIFGLTAESLTHLWPPVWINLFTPEPQCGCTFGIFKQRGLSRLPPSLPTPHLSCFPGAFSFPFAFSHFMRCHFPAWQHFSLAYSLPDNLFLSPDTKMERQSAEYDKLHFHC